MLARAVADAEVLYQASTANDPYRGLHIRPEEIQRLLSQPPGKPLLWAMPDDAVSATGDANGPLAELARAFRLDSFDLDVILIALAPEFDLRYERIYAFLQDDVTRRWPSIDLALDLLCETVETKLVRRVHFSYDAPLLRSGLLQLVADPPQARIPLLAHALRLDDQVVAWLLGQERLDPRLAPFCSLREPGMHLDQLRLLEDTKRALTTLIRETRASGAPLKLYLHGRAGTGKRSTAEALAQASGLRFLSADLREAAEESDDFEQICLRLWREAWFHQALLFVEGIDILAGDEHRRQARCLHRFVAEYPGVVILAGNDPEWAARHAPGEVISVAFGVPDYTERRAFWRAHLGEATLDSSDFDTLAQRFRLAPGQIAAACELARSQARWCAAAQGDAAAPKSAGPALNQVMQAARAQSGHALAKLARKLEPRYRWADIVLPDDQRAQLKESCLQFTHRYLVYSAWGFGRKLSLGRGLNVLFSGPPGTGKTMAAEVIASELGLDLYKIDLSQVVSKYIGETEKNLDRIFAAAEDANAILFFDEADALFGKRSEVKDAHDRYANIEVGYLLQKMEEYEGIAILATNLRSHLDEAFVRRMQAIVEFPFPDEDYRRRIWGVLFPHEAPLGEDVDFGLLAREVRLAGGSLKNIGLASAFYAASDGGVIRMPHVLRAVQREHQKLGRTWNGSGGTLP
jgi:SpoVK/Ycf46/Vps4 family AAA+-type ATPase